MMVASTSLLQQAHQHRYMSTKPSDPDMSYHMQHHSGHRSMDTQDIFHSHNRTLEDIPDAKYPLPTYKEATKANENGGLVSVPSSESGVFYQSSKDSESGSPKNNECNMRDLSCKERMNHDSFPQVQRSPSGLSPPSKRHTLSPQNRYADSRDRVPNRSITSLDMESQMNKLRYSANLKKQSDSMVNNISNNNRFNMSPTTTSTVGYDSSQFYDRSSYDLFKEASESDNSLLSSSPATAHHMSQSSTLSSSSTVSKPTTPGRRTPSSRTSKTPTKASPKVPNFFFDDDDDDSWKICSVCGDKATGYHFNALTCEGCKGFFRRSMKNSKNFVCPYTGNCSITKSNRRQCQACRLQKCLRIGMKKECIMSRTEIQMKKNLMMTNRVKKSILDWKPMDYTKERQDLAELIKNSHCETNNPPDIKEEDGIITVERNVCASPASSMHSGFSDLIDKMTQDIVRTAPGERNMCKAHVRHFSAIMEFSIKEIIKFCKKIPGFATLSLKDQITLLKSGCTEILFIKANYTYDREQGALMCGPGKYYTRESFLAGGMSGEYTDCYLKFHHDLSHMILDDCELACMCAITLFSSDRDELEDRDAVEAQQHHMAVALQAYTENTYHCRVRFPKIMAYLSRLRTLNWHISKTLKALQTSEAVESCTPLILEVVPTV